MQTKIRIKATGKICYCDDQTEEVGVVVHKMANGKEYRQKQYKHHYYISPDSTEEYNEDDIEIIPQTCYELFGVECGEGWSKILEPIFKYIEEYNEGKPEEEHLVPSQIKEKFGTLRVYMNFTTERLEELISCAEEQSARTCELCGSTYDVGRTCSGWITTTCRKCAIDIANKKPNGIDWYSFLEKDRIHFDNESNANQND